MPISKIKPLPKKVYDKIAAGEVIDRPSSILRELLDNSIDSGATEIIIHLSDGGNETIQIIDNGCGMNESDVRICCEPFTTSKIEQFEDLFNLNTYGFRGEALNSISTISRVEIISKSDDEEMATAYTIEGGEEISFSKCSRNRGTTVTVNNIFFNIPARRKSMKSGQSELLSCKEVFLGKAFPNSNISFVLYNNGEKKIELPSTKSLISNIKTMYGVSFAENLIEINNQIATEHGIFTIRGYVGKADLCRPQRSHQYTFINSRPVFSPALSRAIQLAYGNTIPQGKYPVAYLFIVLPKDFIDINVHPAKKEIKFINERLVVSFVIESIKKQFRENTMIPDIGDDINTFQDEYENNHKQIYTKQSAQKNLSLSYENKETDTTSPNNVYTRDYEDEDPVFASDNIGSNFRIVGMVFNTYIIIEKDNELIILDQHAAHERLNYEKLKKKYHNAQITSQILIFPILMETIEEDIDSYIESKDKITKFGFEFDRFGSNAITIRSIPAFFEQTINTTTFRMIFDDIVSDKIDSIEKLIDKSLILKACKMSIKSGDFQTRESISSMITELFEYTNPFACPHGRPTAVKMKLTDIDKLFGRDYDTSYKKKSDDYEQF